MISIVDYGLGNVRAFANLYKQLDVPVSIATLPGHLEGASKVILPGVGAFDQAMERLRTSGMLEPLKEMALVGGIPILGVCVGMQILVDSSEEGELPGLGLIRGRVLRFQAGRDGGRMQIPHMGWNGVRSIGTDPLFSGLAGESEFYFLHSYYVAVEDGKHVSGVATYGEDIAAAIAQNNIRGVQFHPEKSHGNGIRLLKNFADL